MGFLDERLERSQFAFNREAHQPGLEDPKIARTSHIHSDSVGRWQGILTPDEARQVWAATRGLWAAVDPRGQQAARAGITECLDAAAGGVDRGE
jgi:hypothetical protein